MKWLVRYWFKGAPGDREGGPWWERDFTTEFAAQSFYAQIHELCQQIEIKEVSLMYECEHLFAKETV